MASEITFRVYAGDKYVDINTIAEGIDGQALLEVEKGKAWESSVYLSEPNPLKPAQIRSFLTAMKGIIIVDNKAGDAQINISIDDYPSLKVVDGVWHLKLSQELIKKPKDKRRTLAGNLGLFYSLSLYLLEKKYGIISYHSSALVDEKNKLIFINGGEASSGKSVIMLDFMAHYGKGTEYKVLSTEMGHISIKNGEFMAYSGAAFDNISLFPNEPEKIQLLNKLFPNTALPDPNAPTEVRGTDGSVKTPISIKDYYASQDSYSSRNGYKLVYLMPTIKMGKPTQPPAIMESKEYGGLFSTLVGAARQKLGQKQPSWLYDERASLLLPVGALATEQEMEAKTIEDSFKKDILQAVVKIEGNPVDFNKKPGEYWSKIVNLLDLK